MREHNERFPNAKGKLLSSAPIRISIPPQTDKENFVPGTNEPNSMNMPNQTNNDEGMEKEHIPQISISVTMSEANDDEEIYTDGVYRSEPFGVSDDEDNSTVTSVWAMMENYEGVLKDSATPSHSPVRIEENDSDESSNYHSTEESLGSNTKSTDANNQKSDDAKATEFSRVPSGIRWLEDGDGELMQSSYSTQEASESRNDGEFENADNDTTDLSTVDEADKSAIFRQDTLSCISDQAVSSASALRSVGCQGQPTPARVKHEWVCSGEDEDISTNRDSLLQVSMIQSIQMASSQGSRAMSSMPFNLSANLLGNDSDAEFSLSTLPDLKSVPDFEGIVSPAPTDFPTKNARKPKLQIQTQELDSVYSGRLGELESNLKLQQNNTDEVQNRLKKQVMELEQALKVTVATPKGTVVDENPLKILLNRNQTLVKEVRFADQTCVELSSQISELEMHNERLQKKVDALEHENGSLRSDNKSQKNNHVEKDATIENLERELTMINESLRAKTIEEESLQRVLNKTLGDLNFNDDAPGLSLASSIISERDSVFQDHSIDSNNAQLSKAIRQQIGVLVEKAMSSLQTEKLKIEVHDLRSENIMLKSDLLLDQLQLNSEPVPSATSTERSEEILQYQKENEFLGRQLGIVQEKLDQSQNKVNDEHQKSESLKVHLRRSVEIYERLIEPLERRLLEIINCNPKLQDVANADKRLFRLQKEFVQVKTSIAALRIESERALTEPVFNIDMFSNIDQHPDVASMVRATISRMGENYKQLESDVDIMTGGLSDRLDGLASTISHLRSSLLFEKESVSSVGSNGPKKAQEERDGQQCGSSGDLINATIPILQYSFDGGDDMDGKIDGATASQKHEISFTSDLDDISRLLNDDLTLESIIKSVSVLTPMSNMEAFKESLEAAVNECKRVKERSIRLKDQIESHKLTIQELEQEKDKLSLDVSKRSEEFCLVERALGEAKEEIDLLRSTISASQRENENLYEQLKIRDKELKIREEANDRLTKSVAETQKQKEVFEVQINACETALTQTKANLESSMNSTDEYKTRLNELQSNISKRIETAIEKKELESAEIRRALQLALHEKSEFKRFHQDALKRISQEVETKSKLVSQVRDLQHSKLQAQSDLEDKDLESKFAREDMRKERAELKYLLSQSEKEVLSLKESYTNLKANMEDRRQMKEETEIERLDLLSKVNLMTEKRISFVNLLVDLGCCEDLIRVMNSKDYQSDRSSPLELMMKEIDCWKCVIPLIGDKIEAFHHSVAAIPKLEVEIEKLSNDLSKHEIRKSDQSKQAEDHASQNEKLLDLLRQAEQEMERSTLQIKQMSQAMALMQQRENDAGINIELIGSELMKLKNESEANELEKKEDLSNVKHLLLDASAELDKKESQIIEINSQMNSMRSEIEDITSLLRSKESEEHSLKANIQSYEKKNGRLREYIGKLTTKCEEWEISYDRQSRAIDRLQEKKARMKEKASDIACRYRSLVADINRRKKLHQHDREKWSHDRSNLNTVHAALEKELEQIAKELA